MNWYNPKTWVRKANPAQEHIHRDEGSYISTDTPFTYAQAFELLETVNRGVNMIVSGASSLDYDIKDSVVTPVVPGIRLKSLNNLLNFRPNPYQSIQDFRNNIFTDLILDGNLFIHFDGTFMYHLPAAHVEIHTDPKTYVSHYTYNSTTTMLPSEVIHVKDIGTSSIYRGTSRLAAAARNIKILYKMQGFQEQFFDNGAVTGLILTSENTLSESAKNKTISNWMTKYSPKNGARRPMILDSGLKPVSNISETFQEMDFDISIKTHDNKILKALGVPPILLDGGNNANISPNLKLFYLETILPVVTKYTSAIERFFGFDITAVTNNVSALQPELKDLASYLSTLVNSGILSPNEAREELRYANKPGNDELRIPANIAGSASNPSQGGKPPKTAPSSE